MNELILKMNPYHRELRLELPQESADRLLRDIKKLRSAGLRSYSIPADGYQGFELTLENGGFMQVYGETVVYRSGGVIQILSDRKGKISAMLMKEFMEDYAKDVYYIRETINAEFQKSEYRKI